MSTSEYLVELRCAEALAREAGKRVEEGARAGFTIDYKGRNDLVTNVDRSTEEFIRAQLRAMFPSDGIHGEEFGEEDGKQPERQWLVDPIDGTTNFSHRIPIYCISIALQVNKKSVAAVIYDPTRDELFSARVGGGAYLNGVPMRVSDQDTMHRAVCVTGFPPLKSGDTFETITAKLVQMLGSVRGIRRFGSAALDLANVAAGRVDGFWEYGLNPWDTAAGYLLVQEAGGNVTTEAGEEFSAHERSVVATNGHLHQRVLDALGRIQD